MELNPCLMGVLPAIGLTLMMNILDEMLALRIYCHFVLINYYYYYSSIQRSTTLGYLRHLQLEWFCEPHSRYFFIIISKPENSLNSTQDTIISGY